MRISDWSSDVCSSDLILAGDVRVGQPLSATLTAFPGEKFAGRITAILPSAQAQSRTLTVRAELRNPDLRLRPGMFAQVSLAPTRREPVLIPSEAVKIGRASCRERVCQSV